MDSPDLPLFAQVPPETVLPKVPGKAPDAPPVEQFAAHLEHYGWRRAVAGERDFAAACAAFRQMVVLERGLYVWGAAGCGKSALLRAVTAVSKLPVQILPLDDPEYADWLSTASHPGWADGMALGQNVVLDDLGAENALNEFGVRRELAVEFVVRYHARGRGRLLVSTNLDGDQLLARYGARFASRLKDLCVGLHLTGADKRRWNAPKGGAR